MRSNCAPTIVRRSTPRLAACQQMTTTATSSSAISRLFSSSVYRQLAERGRSPLFARLLRDTGLLNDRDELATVGDVFDAAFATLRRAGQRDEYVYRAALTHNILLGRHSLKTASLLTEFRAGTCKADLAILNGTSTAYEIKSERDSLARLQNQLWNYRKVFARVYIVVAEPFVPQVLESTASDVGVMSLVRWDRIKTIREARDRPDEVCPVAIFDSLRSTEAREVLVNLGVTLPEVPNTKQHTAMRECFAELDSVSVHYEMVRVLKRTRSLHALDSFIQRLPMSLRPAALSVQVRPADRIRLVEAVGTPIDQAMDWT